MMSKIFRSGPEFPLHLFPAVTDLFDGPLDPTPALAGLVSFIPHFVLLAPGDTRPIPLEASLGPFLRHLESSLSPARNKSLEREFAPKAPTVILQELRDPPRNFVASFQSGSRVPLRSFRISQAIRKLCETGLSECGVGGRGVLLPAPHGLDQV
jgi:hypothetical protein